jgi:hypothetical protein
LLKLIARRDVIVAVVLLVIGVAYGLMTASLPNRSLPNTPGPAFFPWLITVGLILLPVALLVRSLTDDADESPLMRPDGAAYRRLLMLIWFGIYLVLLPYAGFLPASVPFFAGLMWLYGERNRFALTLATIVIPAGLFYLFRLGFRILLPAGVW